MQITNKHLDIPTLNVEIKQYSEIIANEWGDVAVLPKSNGSRTIESLSRSECGIFAMCYLWCFVLLQNSSQQLQNGASQKTVQSHTILQPTQTPYVGQQYIVTSMYHLHLISLVLCKVNCIAHQKLWLLWIFNSKTMHERSIALFCTTIQYSTSQLNSTKVSLSQGIFQVELWPIGFAALCNSSCHCSLFVKPIAPDLG